MLQARNSPGVSPRIIALPPSSPNSPSMHSVITSVIRSAICIPTPFYHSMARYHSHHIAPLLYSPSASPTLEPPTYSTFIAPKDLILCRVFLWRNCAKPSEKISIPRLYERSPLFYGALKRHFRITSIFSPRSIFPEETQFG